jgi:serine/threonine protein kinase
VLYPGTEDNGIALLYRMLEFNPNKRITAEQAIKDSYFDDIRLAEQECLPPPLIDLSVDDLENESLSIEDLRRLAIEAIKDMSSDNFDF